MLWMGIEIERKFLVKNDSWQREAGEGILFRQGYLARGEHIMLRVRVMEDCACVTLKGQTKGISRTEFEYEIPVDDAEALLDLAESAIIIKKRYYVHHAGVVWEIDVFDGENRGLVLAEIELETESQSFALPEWVGEEVTGDKRYYNAALSRIPFSAWV